MRCFVAVDLDQDLRDKVVDLQKELAGLDTKLVEPENLHFTLKFLGEVDEGVVNKIKGLLMKLAAGEEPFKIDVGGVGVFPSEKFIRVVWLGAPELTNLQVDVNESLFSLFKKETPKQNDAKRQSVVHLTLARVRSQKYEDEILEFTGRNKNIKIGRMQVKNIKLKKSNVTMNGPVYEDVEIFEMV